MATAAPIVLLDEVLETGRPLEIERNGKTLVIAAKEEPSFWDRLSQAVWD